MRTLAVEGGIYFLLLFAPLAFGGVEGWALGIIQAVSGGVFVAWAWGAKDSDRSGPRGGERILPSHRRRLLALWGAISLFVLLVGVQLAPMPPALIQALSPHTFDLYETTLPGFAAGGSQKPAELPKWIVDRMASRIPLRADPGADAAALSPPVPPSAATPPVSRWQTLSIYPFATRQRLALFLSFVALFAVVLAHFNTRDRLARLLAVAVFSGLIVSLLGIVQKFNWNGKLYWIREGNYADPFGPFVDRNTYAAFAGTLLPISICAVFEALRRLAERRVNALAAFLFHGFAAVALAGGIFYSLSRGGMISTTFSIAVIAALLIFFGRQKTELAVLACVLILVASFLLWIGPERIIERVGTLSEGQRTPSFAARIDAWRHAFTLIGDHLIAGTGLGTFAFAFMRYAPAGGSWWNIAHNEPIELLCDTGLAGGALLLAGVTAWLSLVGKPGVFREHTSRYTYTGIVAGLAALILHSCITSNLQIPANGLLLVILGAALTRLAIGQESRNAETDESRRVRGGRGGGSKG